MLESPIACAICRRPIDVDLAGHYRFHRDAAAAFLDLLDRQKQPREWGDFARDRIAHFERLLAGLEFDSRQR
jgi:hypothetical protein